jgi:phenylpropionate dioxygenase-like ring-hydroxylating dioxygenase large terminal subunit
VWKDDITVARAVLDHIDAGSTDRGTRVWREPVANYTSLQRLSDELSAFQRGWLLLCPSTVVAEPGSWQAVDSIGVPVLVVRDAAGCLRVLRNVCRHRGMAVARGHGCSKALVCDYHGWTYALDGSLRHIPHAEGFPETDRAARGLVEIRAIEVDGLVFVNHDGRAPSMESAGLWRGLVQQPWVLVGAAEQVHEVNWKLLTETFLEGLHIGFLHRRTFLPVQYDNVNVVEHEGPFSRVTFPFRNIERLRDRSRDTWTVDHRVTYVYSVFPNGVVATFPGQRLLFVLEPTKVNETRVTTYRFTAGDATAAAVAVDDGPAALLLRGGGEDFDAARSVQRGLTAGANEFLEFGLFESGIVHFHEHLDAIASTVGAVEVGR